MNFLGFGEDLNVVVVAGMLLECSIKANDVRTWEGLPPLDSHRMLI
jgi:hypothetical protein